jgi:hypothetical protein
LLGLFFNPDDGGNMLFWNIDELLLHDTVLHPRIQCCLINYLFVVLFSCIIFTPEIMKCLVKWKVHMARCKVNQDCYHGLFPSGAQELAWRVWEKLCKRQLAPDHSNWGPSRYVRCFANEHTHTTEIL